MIFLQKARAHGQAGLWMALALGLGGQTLAVTAAGFEVVREFLPDLRHRN